MKRSHLQNLVILILIVVNVFLLALVATRELRTARLAEEARSAAAAVLEKNGISVETEALPEDMTFAPCTVERDRAAERALAEALLGEVTEEERGGGVYRYVSGDGKGSMQFHSGGDFSASFSVGAHPLNGQTIKEHAAALAAALGLDGTVSAVTGDEKSGSVTFLQSWQGAPVYTCTMRFQYENNALRSITEGKRVVGTPMPEQNVKLMDVPTALLRFLNGRNELGDVCGKIERMEAGYIMTALLPSQAKLTPVWRFQAETGSYQIDALTGAFTRIDNK